MNLPIAPPAFDATGAARRDHADRGADIGAGCGLAVLELLALGVIFGLWFLTAFNLDPAGTVEADPLWNYLIAAGAVGVVAVAATVIAARARAVVTVVSQVVVMTLTTVIVFCGAVAQHHEDARHDDRGLPAGHQVSEPRHGPSPS